MYTSKHIYHHETQALHGYLAYQGDTKTKRPAVLIAHDWSGQNDFARNKAEEIARLGFIGFALDLYGEGKTGQTTEEKQTLMTPLIAHRDFLQKRMQCSLQEIAQLPMIDAEKIIVIGFCFGGLCALDLARTGASIQGAVSFHGILKAPDNIPKPKIQANILVLHGFDDPMVQPADLNSFYQEMTTANANWQLHIYGQTKHSFMVPEACNPQLGTIYQPQTAQRAWQVFLNFLTENFQSS